MSRFQFPDAPGDLIGAHLSTRGGLHTAFERASAIGECAAAIFAKNSNQWKGKELTDGDCATFASLRNVRPNSYARASGVNGGPWQLMLTGITGRS